MLVDSLLDYTCKITSNTKRFPKSMRYTITDRLIAECIEAAGHLRIASKIHGRKKHQFKQVRKCLDKAIQHLTKFEALMTQAHRACDPKNFEYWSELLTKAYDAISTWYSYENRAKQERYNIKHGIMKTNKNGFFILENATLLKRWNTSGDFIDRD